MDAWSHIGPQWSASAWNGLLFGEWGILEGGWVTSASKFTIVIFFLLSSFVSLPALSHLIIWARFFTAENLTRANTHTQLKRWDTRNCQPILSHSFLESKSKILRKPEFYENLKASRFSTQFHHILACWWEVPSRERRSLHFPCIKEI